MATMLPPVKGAEFSFAINLVSQADTDVFKETVTLAAGDIQVSKDGGAYANLATFPPAELDLASTADSGTLYVTLTAAEMTADVVSVLFRDAAGAEWQSALVTIYTTAQALDTIDSNVDSILADTGTDGVMVANFTVAAKALLQTEVQDALEANDLDHLIQVTAGAEEPTDGSYLDQIMHKSAAQTFDATTDSLEAIRDALGSYGAAAATTTVSSGTLSLRTYHTWSQVITSTSTAALNTATKVWLAAKLRNSDADSASVFFIEAAGGLTVLAEAAYATTANGTLVVGGSSGAWTITAGMQEAATGQLTNYIGQTLIAECKALVGGDTVLVWSGVAVIDAGIVRTYA